jgi:hypothetical protein
MPYPRSPAAFINTIAESGSKDEAIQHLQETWNEVVALRETLNDIANGAADPQRLARNVLAQA